MVIFRSFLYDSVFVGIVGPAWQWPILVVLRIDAASVGGLHVLCGHHMIPTPDKIGTLIVKTNPLKIRGPGGVIRVFPFLHFLPTMGAGGLLFCAHDISSFPSQAFCLYKLITEKQKPNPRKNSRVVWS
jgi:hypothetical protein